uniref:hypothetical protein n=1 Tax=Prevotella sp. TaxID=59823 RepID=UPI00402851F5
MKKILTLMAAMSACAGTAMASDFNFANPTVDAKEDGSALTYNETAKAFSFTVTAEDEITLTATGAVTVKLNGAALTAVGGKYTATSDGTLTIELGTSAVTKIVVVSSNSRKVQTEIEKAQAKMGEAIAAVAKYVGYSEFYNKVQAEVSKAGQKVQDVKAKLAVLKETNKVTNENRDALIAELNSTTLLADGTYGAVKMAEDAIAKADATFALFTKIIGTDAKVALDALTKANGTATQGEWVVNGGEKINNTTMFTHNLKAVKNHGIVTGTALDGFKTTWIESEWKNLNDEVNKTIKDAAVAELGKYPNAFVENDEQAFVAMYNEVVEKLRNVIARANFERDNLKTVNDLTAKVNKVDAALKAGAPFALDADNDFTLLKEQITAMQTEINSSENRYMYSQDNFSEFVNTISGVSTKLDGFYTELVGKARTDLQAKLKAAQENLTKVSYEVSAKYEHESATQKEYQKQFSEQQNKLDEVKKNVAASAFPTVQTDYKTFVDQISNINKKVDEIWGTTLSSQKAEILTHNQAAKDQIFKAIDAVRADYSLYVEKINTWINDDATKKAATDLKANLNELFSIVNGLDDMKAEVTEAVDKMTENIKKESDEEFGAHYEANKNIYRLTEDKVTGYLNSTKTVSDAIYDELKEAATTANAKAYDFVKTNTGYGVKSIRWANNLISDAKYNVKTGDKNEKMSAEAAAKFKAAYDKIAQKDLTAPKGEQGEGYVKIAETEIERLYNYDINKADFKDNILADKVVKNKEGKRELPEQYIAPVETAVNALNNELESYKAQYKDIYALKVDWNTAKAKEDELQAKVDAWEKANNVAAENHFNVNKELTAVNENLAKTLENLEKGCLTATKCQDATDKAKENYAVKMYMIQHFTEAKANEAAAPVVSAKVAEVEKAIADARTKVAVYADDIKNKANADLNTIEGKLTDLKKSIDLSVEKNTIAANKDGFIANLTTLAGDVTKVLEAAAQAAKDADLDYNGDGKVDVKDLVDADADFQNTGDGFTFYKFLDAYLEYLSK